MPEPFVMCSKEEYQERQNAKDVTEWEATGETWTLQAKYRALDPCLAVSKYRRSAAGTLPRKPRSLINIWKTWEHLKSILIHQRIHQSQSPQTLLSAVCFINNRLRALQVDLVVSQRVSGIFQLQVARYHILTLYLLSNVPTQLFEPKFSRVGLQTALTSFWDDPSSEEWSKDEILCYSTLCHVAASVNNDLCVMGNEGAAMTLEITSMYRNYVAKGQMYRRFSQALSIAVAIQTQHFYIALSKIHALPIMDRLCLAPCLHRLRWLCLHQFNKAFPRGHALPPSEVARLLYLPSEEAATDFATSSGIPIDKDGNLQFKLAPMAECKISPSHLRRWDDWFCFGDTINFRTDADQVTIPCLEILHNLISSESCHQNNTEFAQTI
jgi:SAC3/GANP family